MELSPEDRERIHQEEKARLEAQAKLKAEEQAKKNKQIKQGCLGCLGLLILLGVIGAFLPKSEHTAKRTPLSKAENAVKGDLVASPLPSTGKWGRSSSTSSFDDSRTVVLTLEAENSISGWPGKTKTPDLILRCKENKTEAYINVGMRGKPEFGEYGQKTGVQMRARYDKGEPYEYLMGESTDGEALFFEKPIEEIKFMMKHASMVAEFIPFNSSPAEIHFDLTGLEDAVKPLREACGW